MRKVALVHRRWLCAPGLAVALTIAVVFGIAATSATGAQSDPAVKAAFLYNFAKFTEWPTLPAGSPIILCIVGDDKVAEALVEIVRGQTIGGRMLNIWRPEGATTWRTCQLVFIPDVETQRSAERLGGLKTLPVLTVSDRKGFAESGGLIELYLDGGRVRFAINVDAVERSGLRISSRLLGLAKVVRDRHVQ